MSTANKCSGKPNIPWINFSNGEATSSPAALTHFGGADAVYSAVDGAMCYFDTGRVNNVMIGVVCSTWPNGAPRDTAVRGKPAFDITKYIDSLQQFRNNTPPTSDLKCQTYDRNKTKFKDEITLCYNNCYEMKEHQKTMTNQPESDYDCSSCPSNPSEPGPVPENNRCRLTKEGSDCETPLNCINWNSLKTPEPSDGVDGNICCPAGTVQVTRGVSSKNGGESVYTCHLTKPLPPKPGGVGSQTPIGIPSIPGQQTPVAAAREALKRCEAQAASMVKAKADAVANGVASLPLQGENTPATCTPTQLAKIKAVINDDVANKKAVNQASAVAAMVASNDANTKEANVKSAAVSDEIGRASCRERV